MDSKQLTQGLKQAFFTEGHRIVFWYDPEQAFADALDKLGLEGVQLLDMQQASSFETKLRLELDDTQGKYLLYFPWTEPEAQDDWLLDIKLYSRSFHADRISMIFNELGLQQQSLREHLRQRQRFLSSKSRVTALGRLLPGNATAEEIDLAMIAVLLGAGSFDISTLLFSLAEQSVSQDTGLESNPSVVDELCKYDLQGGFLRALAAETGYPAGDEELRGEAPFSLGNLLIRLLTTAFCESISDIPGWASSMAIPSANARATSRALLSRWRDSSRFYPCYDVISGWVATALNIESRFAGLSLETLANVSTFEAVERQIIVDLAKAIPGADRRALQSFDAVIATRLDAYWASRHKDDETRRRYRLIYRALSAAIELFDLRQQYPDGFHFASCAELYQVYCDSLYRFDLAYRHYTAASLRAHMEILKALDEAVEQCYACWFLDQLGRAWGDRVESEQRLQDWSIPGVPSQQAFFRHWVEPLQDKVRNKRIVVIISDAFRYEAATELVEQINIKRYSKATLGSQLGVLPSYTSLGMASLLPHQALEYRAASGDDVLVDGLSSKGTAARNKILAAHGGMAITAEQLRQWSREKGREALRDQHLVYVYHNVVDARGDSASTELETFQAVEHAIEELTELTRKVLMHFNTSTVIVTADHGFLFQMSKLEAADRTSLAEKPASAFKSKKRYVLGFDLPDARDAWSGSTRETAGTLSDTRFWIPKGANRFHFVGRARFVHGGAMPQEIVVPVVTVQQLRGEKAEKRTRRKVGVISPKSSLKMTTNIQSFDLMQTEAVSEQRLPVTVAVAIYHEGQQVSSEETLTFDCETDSMTERLKRVRLSLSGSDFDRRREYFLVIRDKDLDTELERYRVTIDLAFTDDFF